MPSNDQDLGLQGNFLDDFYAECDEHLLEVRRALLLLERETGKNEVNSAALDPLFRNIHSLKGILGMAGLLTAETLAHKTEDFLRTLSRAEVVLDEESLNLLNAGAQALEQILSAHRQQQSLPDVSLLIQQMATLTQAKAVSRETERQKPSAKGGEVRSRLQAALRAGKKIWQCVFVPSPELQERGMNVNTIRTRLQTLGEVMSSVPKNEPGGKISFEFLVAVEANALDLGPWTQEGTTLKEVDVSELPAGHAGATTGPSRPETQAAAQAASVTPSHIVRVDLGRLDELMQTMGEMVMHRARLDEAVHRASQYLPTGDFRILQETSTALARELRRLRDGLMRVRLVPIAEIFERMALVVRDLARESGRKVRLTVQGQQTEIDKYVVERLKDPLLHLVRNAVTHGYEPPAERSQRGKSPELNVLLRAAAVGESVLVEVEDDGHGIDVQSVKEHVRAAGVDGSDTISESDLLDILCRPGFSTRD